MPSMVRGEEHYTCAEAGNVSFSSVSPPGNVSTVVLFLIQETLLEPGTFELRNRDRVRVC